MKKLTIKNLPRQDAASAVTERCRYATFIAKGHALFTDPGLSTYIGSNHIILPVALHS
jgi:hypothetical protein